MSLMGHLRPGHSAPVSADVRYTSVNDRIIAAQRMTRSAISDHQQKLCLHLWAQKRMTTSRRSLRSLFRCFDEASAAAYCLPPFSLHFFMLFTCLPLLQMTALDPPSPGLAEAANGAATNITAMKQAKNILTIFVILEPFGEASQNLGCQSIYPTFPR